MRNRISLYIADKLVDLDNQSFILFNYTMDDLANPTIVKNSYSQQITLPATPANNAIFGHLGRSDRKTTGSASSGVSFNPLARTPFYILNELNERIESGYCKVEGVTASSYKIGLYGGLGAFLYKLKYKEDDEPRTLADLTYKSGNNYYTTSGLVPEAARVWAAWNDLKNGRNGIYQIINWVPADNGFPEGMDCKHALFVDNASVVPGDWANLNASSAPGYGPHPDYEGTYLLEMENEHKELEMMEFRADKLRPAISVKAFLQAVTIPDNVPGFNVTIDESFLGSSVVRDMWMILPYATDNKKPLQLGATPADYLVDIIKMFGLKILVGGDGKTISIMTNTSFFTQEVVDLSTRVDTIAKKDITPCVAAHRYYQFANDVNGAFSKSYQEKFGRAYGCQKVNTGYEFDNETSDLLATSSLKGAADVLDASPNYIFGYQQTFSYFYPFFMPAQSETCKFEAYNDQGEELESTSVEVSAQPSLKEWWNDEAEGSFNVPLMQLRDDSNKPIDASGVMCFFCGMTALPKLTGDTRSRWRITDTSTLMLSMNGAQSCYDLRLSDDYAVGIQEIPHFRRTNINSGKSLEYGIPLEVATQESMDNVVTIYQDWWRKFIQDRYDKDSRKLVVKVNLLGMKVDAELLRKFYYFAGSLWSLNAIKNHSLTTADLTECEFIKVKDVANYRIEEQERLYIQADQTDFTFTHSAGSVTFLIKSNQPWTITGASGAVSLNRTSGGQSGATTTTAVKLSVLYNQSTSSRSWALTILANDGQTLTLNVTQEGEPVVPPGPQQSAIVNRDMCVGCAECIYVCPTNAISMDWEDKAVVDKDSCIICRTCVSKCPVEAITIGEVN